MKIYYENLQGQIENVSDEKFTDSELFIEAESYDEMYQKLNMIGELSQEVEESLAYFFETEIAEEADSLMTFDIKHWVSNRSFGELIDMYHTGEILKPQMQRNFVWDPLKCSRLIESIILGLPIPPLFLLEVEKNSYEIIDGFQRLTTLYNFVRGYPWNHIYKSDKDESSRSAKLSSKVSKEISGKTFNQLEPDYQRIIKRSTLPLIEFKQLSPDDDFGSKFLIFERINTGSEKLTPMQIRRSLAYGPYIKSMYEFTNSNNLFNNLFTIGNLKKDLNVEAMIRIFMVVDYIDSRFIIDNSGIKNNLNKYCESKRNEEFDEENKEIFNAAFSKVLNVFGGTQINNKMFRRVYKNDDGEYIPTGNLNISILEAFMSTLIHKLKNGGTIDNISDELVSRYCDLIFEKSEEAHTNPFSISTGSKLAIDGRIETMEGLWMDL